jgi:hypothetical protein
MTLGPGCGKTRLVNEYLKTLRPNPESSVLSPDYICAASTGAASINLRDGRTIHSVFNFGKTPKEGSPEAKNFTLPESSGTCSKFTNISQYPRGRHYA